MEFDLITSFNELRGKEFVRFDQFETLTEEHDKIERYIFKPNPKTKLVLVSGIPGSGKYHLADTVT